MSTASWTGLRKKKTLETRNEPGQNEIRSVTVTHQFNANIVRRKSRKLEEKTMENSGLKAIYVGTAKRILERRGIQTSS